MSSLILSIAHRTSTGSKIVAPKVTTKWTRYVATALRTAADKDLEGVKKEESDANSNHTLTPSSIKDSASEAAMAKGKSGKSRPALSTFFHDVDELLFQNKNPFFTPFWKPFFTPTQFMDTFTPTSSLHKEHMDMISHFWKQMDSMDDMRRKRYLENFFSNNIGIEDKDNNYFFFPNYDIHSDDDKLQIILDLPGVKMKDININIVDDQWLQISGHRKKKSSIKNGKSVESNSTSTGATPTTMTSEYKFEKRFNFGDNVIDPTKIIASLADGVLRVSLPKLSQPESSTVSENVKKIDIVDGSEELEC